MSNVIRAGTAFHWFGVTYAAGDVVNTTGWSSHALRELFMDAPVYVDTGAYQTVVNHGATAGTTRPAGASKVFWIGSVVPTNGVDGDEWRDTAHNLTRYNVAGVWFYPPGAEVDYAERVTSDTTTNTARASAASNLISGLSVSVVGTGQPFDIEYYCESVVHSVAATFCGADLIVNGVAAAEQLAAVDSPSTANGRTLILRRRKVLVAGTSYTFQIGKWGQAAGTATYAAGAAAPMHLALTAR